MGSPMEPSHLTLGALERFKVNVPQTSKNYVEKIAAFGHMLVIKN